MMVNYDFLNTFNLSISNATQQQRKHFKQCYLLYQMVPCNEYQISEITMCTGFYVFLYDSFSCFLFFRKIVTNREWCGSLKYYTNCRQTWAIENFYSHTLLHYCPKQNSFSYDSYHIRNMLAILLIQLPNNQCYVK